VVRLELDVTKVSPLFGETEVNEGVGKGTSLNFIPPEVTQPGSYHIEYSVNGVDFQQTNSDMMITFHADFAVKRLSLDKLEQTKEETGIGITVEGERMPTRAEQGWLDMYCVFTMKED
jgi:hypothetical protein